MAQGAKIDVGGRALEVAVLGVGSPAVVFECGIEDDSTSLAGLAQAVAGFTRTLRYDRAGLGGSDPALVPRTCGDLVSDLRAVLRGAGIDGPYLLVGHSFGGMIVRLFAARHPAEVAGIVLLDAAHPEQWTRMLALLPPVTPDEPPALAAFRAELSADLGDPGSNAERIDIAASAAQVRAAGGLQQIPLTVISAGLDEWEPGFPAAVAARIEADWDALQQDLAALSTRGTRLIARHSYHAIQAYEPELVVAAIRAFVDEVRAPR